MSYNTEIRPAQGFEQLTEAQIISPKRQAEALFSRQPLYHTQRDVKQAIIQEWLTGCYNEYDAIFWLASLKLLRRPHRGDPYKLMVDAAKAEFGSVEIPERVTAPIQGYADPELVKALAPARASGGNANG